ncbi:MAG: chitobiase/beta-hexosaminidase C-terminal domain-containing protein [Lachnospiraceae bacterium]|nr:chitobiase/beta-hexosaminidase C-terminal domain-containing protein [Lachnospiraceae bacterium]
MKCQYCGNEIEEGKVYCSFCGKEARFIPDYNELDDKLLSYVSGQETGEIKPVYNPDIKKNVSDDLIADKDELRQTVGFFTMKVKLVILFVALFLSVITVITCFIVNSVTENRNYNSYDYQMEMGQASQDAKEYDDAFDYYNRALEIKENDSDALIALAELYLATGDEASYIDYLNQALDTIEDKTIIYKMLINYYDDNEEYDKIIDLCNSLDDKNLLYLFTEYLVPKPIFSSNGGNFSESFELSINAMNDCTVFYTLDGSDPSVNGYLYDDTITIDEGHTIVKAIAMNSKGVCSDVAEAEFEVVLKELVGPSASLPSGDYPDGGEITLTCESGFVIFYTWDGSTPNELSSQYVTPLQIPDGASVLSCVGMKPDGTTTPVTTYYYTKNVAQ